MKRHCVRYWREFRWCKSTIKISAFDSNDECCVWEEHVTQYYYNVYLWPRIRTSCRGVNYRNASPRSRIPSSSAAFGSLESYSRTTIPLDRFYILLVCCFGNRVDRYNFSSVGCGLMMGELEDFTQSRNELGILSFSAYQYCALWLVCCPAVQCNGIRAICSLFLKMAWMPARYSKCFRGYWFSLRSA